MIGQKWEQVGGCGRKIMKRKAKTIRVWHYTTQRHLALIIQDKEIRQATAGLPPGERPVVWCSVNEIWEPTAAKKGLDGRGMTKEQTHKLLGLARIRVLPQSCPYDWNHFRKHAGCPEWFAKALVTVAKEKGADPKQWRVSYEPIPQSQWINIEIWDGQGWVLCN